MHLKDSSRVPEGIKTLIRESRESGDPCRVTLEKIERLYGRRIAVSTYNIYVKSMAMAPRPRGNFGHH